MILATCFKVTKRSRFRHFKTSPGGIFKFNSSVAVRAGNFGCLRFALLDNHQQNIKVIPELTGSERRQNQQIRLVWHCPPSSSLGELFAFLFLDANESLISHVAPVDCGPAHFPIILPSPPRDRSVTQRGTHPCAPPHRLRHCATLLALPLV